MINPEQKKRSYAIIGAGAVGGYYGVRLQQAGFDVHYLLHTSYEQAKENGLTITTKNDKILVPKMKAYADSHEMPACDVIIIALKTTQNKLLPKILPALLKEDSIIINMQNGLGNEEYLATITNSHPILCATITLGAIKTSPINILIKHEGPIKIAEYCQKPQVTETAKIIAADFNRSKIPTELYEDYLLIRWQKLLWNIPFNALSVIENSTVDLLIKNHHHMINAVAKEIINIAKAYNKVISTEYFEKMIAFTQTLIGYETSMKNDYKNRKPLEIEYIYENPLAAAAVKNIKCPTLENLYSRLIQLDF